MMHICRVHDTKSDESFSQLSMYSNILIGMLYVHDTTRGKTLINSVHFYCLSLCEEYSEVLDLKREPTPIPFQLFGWK